MLIFQHLGVIDKRVITLSRDEGGNVCLDLSIATLAGVGMDVGVLQQALQDALSVATSDGSVGGYDAEANSTGTVDEPIVGMFRLHHVYL